MTECYRDWEAPKVCIVHWAEKKKAWYASASHIWKEWGLAAVRKANRETFSQFLGSFRTCVAVVTREHCHTCYLVYKWCHGNNESVMKPQFKMRNIRTETRLWKRIFESGLCYIVLIWEFSPESLTMLFCQEKITTQPGSPELGVHFFINYTLAF